MAVTKSSMTFPFFKLPPEVRNMVYAYLLRSKNTINLNQSYILFSGLNGVEINLFYVNRQMCKEATSLFYAMNSIIINTNISHLYRSTPVLHGIIRQDTASRTPRSLRHGRFITSTRHIGRLYPHVLARLASIRVNFYWPANKANWPTSSHLLRSLLQALYQILKVEPEQRNKVFCFHFNLEQSVSPAIEWTSILEAQLLHHIEDHAVIKRLRELNGIRKVKMAGKFTPQNIQRLQESVNQVAMVKSSSQCTDL